jgi:hypothetical protein
MRCSLQRPRWAAFFAFALTCGTAAANDDDWMALGNPGHWRLVVSPYTKHYRYNPEHKPVWALGVERQRNDGWMGGLTYFRNSFGQPSAYAYLGQRYEGLLDQPPLYLQWSVGVLYGYRGKYQSKVPLNVNGYAPGALIGLGWHFNKQLSAQFHLLGDAGVMLQVSWDLVP